jgi:hypothetical protein
MIILHILLSNAGTLLEAMLSPVLSLFAHCLLAYRLGSGPLCFRPIMSLCVDALHFVYDLCMYGL